MYSCAHPIQQRLFDLPAIDMPIADSQIVRKRKEPAYYPNCSEMRLSGQAAHCLSLLAPVLKLLSEQATHRWLTLVSPPTLLTMQWLRDAGLNPERTLILHPRGLQSSQELACLALETGCSHTVVSWLPGLTPTANKRLSNAALAGNAQSININQSFRAEDTD